MVGGTYENPTFNIKTPNRCRGRILIKKGIAYSYGTHSCLTGAVPGVYVYGTVDSDMLLSMSVDADVDVR